MTVKTEDKLYDDKEAERRATDALRRALTTPYKPQREMVGKFGKARPKKSKQRNRIK